MLSKLEEYVKKHPVLNLGEMIVFLQNVRMLTKGIGDIDYLFDHTAIGLSELYIEWIDDFTMILWNNGGGVFTRTCTIRNAGYTQ